jgi:hypothetical protein
MFSTLVKGQRKCVIRKERPGMVGGTVQELYITADSSIGRIRSHGEGKSPEIRNSQNGGYSYK